MGTRERLGLRAQCTYLASTMAATTITTIFCRLNPTPVQHGLLQHLCVMLRGQCLSCLARVSSTSAYQPPLFLSKSLIVAMGRQGWHWYCASNTDACKVTSLSVCLSSPGPAIPAAPWVKCEHDYE